MIDRAEEIDCSEGILSLSAPNQQVSIHEKLSQSLDSDWSFCFSVPDPGGLEADLISLHC